MSSPTFLSNSLHFIIPPGSLDTGALDEVTTAVFLVSRSSAFNGSLLPYLASGGGRNHFDVSIHDEIHPWEVTPIGIAHFAAFYSHSSSLQFSTALRLRLSVKNCSEIAIEPLLRYFQRFPYYPKKQLQTLVLSNFHNVSADLIRLLSSGFTSCRQLIVNNNREDFKASTQQKLEWKLGAEAVKSYDEKKLSAVIKSHLNADDDKVFQYLEKIDIKSENFFGGSRPFFPCPFFQIEEFGSRSLRSLRWQPQSKITTETIDFFNSLDRLESLRLTEAKLDDDALRKNPIEKLSGHLKNLELLDGTLSHDFFAEAMLTMFTKGNCIRGKSPLRSLAITTCGSGLKGGTRDILRELEGLERLEVSGCYDLFSEDGLNNNAGDGASSPEEALFSPEYSELGKSVKEVFLSHCGLMTDSRLIALSKMKQLEILKNHSSAYDMPREQPVSATGFRRFFCESLEISKSLRVVDIGLPTFEISNDDENGLLQIIMKGDTCSDVLKLSYVLVNAGGVEFLKSGKFVDEMMGRGLKYFSLISTYRPCEILDVTKGVVVKGDEVVEKLKHANLLT